MVNQRSKDVDLVYLMKRLLPLLLHYDKEMGSEMAQQAVKIIKGQLPEK